MTLNGPSHDQSPYEPYVPPSDERSEQVLNIVKFIGWICGGLVCAALIYLLLPSMVYAFYDKIFAYVDCSPIYQTGPFRSITCMPVHAYPYSFESLLSVDPLEQTRKLNMGSTLVSLCFGLAAIARAVCLAIVTVFYGERANRYFNWSETASIILVSLGGLFVIYLALVMVQVF